jgi:putative ABC transport system permease protein
MKNDSVQVIVGGVFEDIPLNSRMEDCKLVTSLSTLGKIWSGFENGSEWWVGNDRYTSLIRLSKSSKIDDIYPQVHKMKMENLPVNDLKKSGTDLNYTFTQLSKAFTNDPSIKKMTWILSLLAFLLLFSAVMNYLLIVIGNMVGRSKEMAIRKCYGAEGRNIHSIIFSEALVHVLISVVFAALLLYACKGTIENLLSAPLSVLLFNKGSWILGAIVVFVLLIGGIVPGFLYSSVPVASAFRGYNNNRHRWKLGLLSIQFITVGFLISLLFVINRQYNMMLNDNPGFQYHDVAVAYVPGITSEQSEKLLTEFSTIPGVEKVSSADNLLTHGQSGNNIYLPNDDREYFNISDLYNVSDNYLSTMGIKILQGRNFTEGADSLKEVMVSQAFVDTMKVLAHWDNNAIGRRIIITEHSHHNSTFTICGVYNNLCMGSLNDPDIRPSVMFYTRKPCSNILIKFHSLTSESMKALSNKGKSLYPDKETGVYSYATLMSDLYQSQKNFRSGVLIEGLVTFFLALLGLIGYTNDEVNRRHKEIALRKVNGAEVNDIIKIFISDIMRIALPSLVVGAIGAYFVATKWLELFSERISLNLLIFVASVLVVLIFILVTVIANCYRVANSNPVDYLRADN